MGTGKNQITGTGNTKKNPVWEQEFKVFPLGNIREQEFPLMPGILNQKQHNLLN